MNKLIYMLDYKKYLSGGLSGIIEVVFTHPLDYIKTKKQEYTQIQKLVNTNNSFYRHLLKEKNMNFYKGVVPRICGIIPMRFVFWGVQDNSYHYFTNTLNYSPFYSGVFAGIMGGSCQTIIDNPIEVIKIKTMTNQKINLNELLQYNGFKATLIRNVGFSICISSICFGKENRTDLQNFGYSASAGLIGSIITQPMDFVKTQQQRVVSNETIKSILIENFKEAPTKLFVGGLNRALLSFFIMGIGFLAYDKLNKLIC